MSYYVIDGIPVFLTWAKYYQLSQEIMNRFKIGDDCFYGIRGRNSEEALLLTSAINDLLQEKKNRNEESFYSDWVSFDLDQDEATDNVWELLCDYSHLTQNSEVRNIRVEQPIARLFALDIMANKGRFSRWLFGQKRTSTLMIDTNRITKIQGTLDDFIMIYSDKQIRFASLIELDDSLSQEAY